MKRILFLLLLTVSVYGQNPSRFAKIQITGNTTSGTATKVNVQEANGEVNTQSINTAFNKNFGLNSGDVVGADNLLNQYSTVPSNWVAQNYTLGSVVFYAGKQWIANMATVAGDVPSVSSKWEEMTFESLANKTVAVDQTIIDGSTNAVSGNAVKTYVSSLRNSIYYRGKDIDFFGDSYTQGSGASVSANRWTSIISRILGATEINHGVAGTTLMKRTPIDYMASPNMVGNVVNIPIKTASKAMLVFAFGLNDMGQTSAAYTTANFKTDYQFVLDNAYSKGWLPSQILIIPAYYIGSVGYAAYATITGNAAPTEARHLSFIQAAKEVAGANGTMYFDIYQDQKKNDTTLLDPDNIHPNDAGYAYIANDVLQYLGSDKIGTTLNTTWDLKAGFIPNNNGSVFYNSLIYDSGARIGIGTISPQSTLHLNSLVNTVDQRFTNSVTGSTDLDGTSLSVDLNADFVVNNYENKGVITATNNTIRNYTNNIGQTIFGGMTASNTTDKVQVIGSARAKEWVSDNGSLGALYFGRNGLTNLYVIGSDNALGGSINDVAYYSYSGNHKFYQPVFAPTAPAGTNTTQVATTAFVTGVVATARPYKVYTALLSQSGTNAPTATVLENTLGGTPTLNYIGVGNYAVDLTGAFTSGKTGVIISNGIPLILSAYRLHNDRVIMNCGAGNDRITNATIEIRVYN